jgi:hypothetical protein
MAREVSRCRGGSPACRMSAVRGRDSSVVQLCACQAVARTELQSASCHRVLQASLHCSWDGMLPTSRNVEQSRMQHTEGWQLQGARQHMARLDASGARRHGDARAAAPATPCATAAAQEARRGRARWRRRRGGIAEGAAPPARSPRRASGSPPPCAAAATCRRAAELSMRPRTPAACADRTRCNVMDSATCRNPAGFRAHP